MPTTPVRTWQGRSIQRAPEHSWTLHCDNCQSTLHCLDEDDALRLVVEHRCQVTA